MELFSTLFIETFAATLHALSNGRTLVAPQDFPVERAYTKFIFNLESRENEDEFEVVIKAKLIDFRDECNRYTPPSSSLIKAPAGYYFIDRPVSGQTAMACATRTLRAEVFDIALRDNRFPYNSHAPIVIHAFHGIHVEYEVIAKTASGATDNSDS
ncbi:hypothetical protein [Pseudomonas azotoformans]|uniref:Uncharacterized protein n=1 Tax=Pseudomonas azotoformans TaxID=47878 RepID=A0A127HSY7_PSEAZ|nr:hypothetical protein [Pseudomonas azotoformans]AMN77610.1 hypothetical protein AYR47_04390 [Pseudomonas azotoformans]